MKILEFECSGYKRLHLAQINYIHLIPTEKLQLILGTNGSGKSSLLKELSPMPASASDYLKDGHKKIIYEHRGKIYRLESRFSPSQRHNFIIDGEEHNPGGTLSVQKELVKREFNISPEIHELMLGNTVFNSMGPGERRQWFTRLNSTNYSYAINVYQKLKEKLRDIQGAIKMNQSRSIQEANKLLSPEQEKTLSEEIVEHRSFIDRLLSEKSSTKHFGFELRKDAKQNEEDIKRFSDQIIRLRGQFLNLEGFSSIEAIGEEATQIQIKISQLEYIINLTAQEIEKQQKVNETLVNANISSLKDADKKIDEINGEFMKNRDIIQRLQVFDNVPQAREALNGIYDNLVNILSEISPNPDKLYSPDNYQKLIEQNQVCHQLKLGYENQQNKLFAQKKYQEERKQEDSIECPKCSYQWKQGYNEKTYLSICQQLDDLEKSIINNDKKAKEIEEQIEQTKAYFVLYRSYMAITSATKSLSPLWTEINESEIFFKEPRSIIHLLERTRNIFSQNTRIEVLKNELDALVKLKLLTEQTGTEHLEKTKTILAELDEKLYTENHNLRIAKARLQELRNYQKTATDIQLAEARLSALVDKQAEIHDHLVEELKQSLLNNLIRDTQLELSRKEQQLSQVNIQKALVDSIQRQLAELEQEAEVTKLLVEELSPTTGLIAKGLLGFINSFVQQMNSFIRKVWLYPMEIIPMLPDEEEGIDLDYKFSVRVNNANTIPDIKQASSAMSEVINLAFLIVTLKYLGLGDGILHLDEFAHSMDSAHRQSAFSVISNLLTQSEFTQIFVVSHFEDCYGSLRNAEVAVLCAKNIIIPRDSIVNKHIMIR